MQLAQMAIELVSEIVSRTTEVCSLRLQNSIKKITSGFNRKNLILTVVKSNNENLRVTLKKLFKMLQMPNGTQMIKNISADRRKRLRDVHAFIVNHFRTLNAIHTRILQDQSNQEQVFSDFLVIKNTNFWDNF